MVLTPKIKAIQEKQRSAAGPLTWVKALTYVLANAKLVRGINHEWGNIPKLTNRDAAGLLFALKDAEEYRLSKGVTTPWAPADWYHLALPALGWFHRGDKFDMSAKWQEHEYQPAFAQELISFLIRTADELDRAHIPAKVLRDPRGTDALYRQLAMEAYRRMQHDDPASADVKPHKLAPGQNPKAPTKKPDHIIVKPPAPSPVPPRAISTEAHDGDETPILVPDKSIVPPPIVVETPHGPAIATPSPVAIPVTQPPQRAEAPHAEMPDDESPRDDGGGDATEPAPAPSPPRQARPGRDEIDSYRSHHGLPPVDWNDAAHKHVYDDQKPSSRDDSPHDDDDDVRPAKKKQPAPSSDGSGALIFFGLLMLAAASD